MQVESYMRELREGGYRIANSHDPFTNQASPNYSNLFVSWHAPDGRSEDFATSVLPYAEAIVKDGPEDDVAEFKKVYTKVLWGEQSDRWRLEHILVNPWRLTIGYHHHGVTRDMDAAIEVDAQKCNASLQVKARTRTRLGYTPTYWITLGDKEGVKVFEDLGYKMREILITMEMPNTSLGGFYVGDVRSVLYVTEYKDF